MCESNEIRERNSPGDCNFHFQFFNKAQNSRKSFSRRQKEKKGKGAEIFMQEKANSNGQRGFEQLEGEASRNGRNRKRQDFRNSRFATRTWPFRMLRSSKSRDASPRLIGTDGRNTCGYCGAEYQTDTAGHAAY